MASPFRQTVRSALLRGSLARVWAARRGRQLDRAYCAHLLGTSKSPAGPEAAPAIGATGALRQTGAAVRPQFTRFFDR